MWTDYFIPLYGYKKKKTDNNTGEDVEKLEQLYIACRNVMQCSHFGK